MCKIVDKRNEICYNQGEDESRNPIGMKMRTNTQAEGVFDEYMPWEYDADVQGGVNRGGYSRWADPVSKIYMGIWEG